MASPESRSPRRTDKRFLVAWLVLSAIATPLVAIFLGPAIPPGNGSAQATGQVFDNTVIVAVVTPICVFVVVFFVYALVDRSAVARRRVVDGPPIRGDARIQLLWIVVTTVDGALPRRLRDATSWCRTARAAARGRTPPSCRGLHAGAWTFR